MSSNAMMSYVLKRSAGQMLTAMQGVLKKAADHAAATGVEEAVFLSARLYPDMLPMGRQVQIACDMVARAAARLAGAPMPSFPDEEKTFAELAERCGKALAFVSSMPDEAIDAAAERVIDIPMGGGTTLPMEGRAYLTNFTLSNLHFHCTTAYALLRHQGVVLGKRDYVGGA